MAPAARPVAAVPFRKLRRDVTCACGLPHSLHIMSSPTAVWLPAAPAAAFTNVLAEWSCHSFGPVNVMIYQSQYARSAPARRHSWGCDVTVLILLSEGRRRFACCATATCAGILAAMRAPRVS